IVIGCIWLFSSALAVPNAIALRVKNLPDDRGNLVPVCGVHNMDPVTMQMYMHILVCVQYFFPLGIITFAYVRIGWELWGAQTPGNANDGRDAQVLKNKKNLN
ncbi:Orexin receptor type 1, partial [Armadillidium nasatum]